MRRRTASFLIGSALAVLVLPNTGTAHHVDDLPRTSAMVRVWPDLVDITRANDGRVTWAAVRARGIVRYRNTHPAAEAAHRAAERRSPNYHGWMAVASCESERTWDINTGNGYYGGLQMDRDFARTYDPAAYAQLGTPDRWPVWRQMRAADRAYETRGLRPWPNCGYARFGFRF